jgi:ribonuclease HI
MVAGCGGVFRGKNGKWICDFSKALGACSAYVAELWGVFEGLKLARLCGFRKVQLHIDSWVVASTLALREGGTADGWSLLQNIRRLLELEWEIKIRHSYREANKCADALVNMTCDGGYSFMLYEHCPAQINLLFLADSISISTPHFVKR